MDEVRFTKVGLTRARKKYKKSRIIAKTFGQCDAFFAGTDYRLYSRSLFTLTLESHFSEVHSRAVEV